MGKTKTAFVAGVADEEKSGKEAYEAKRQKREEEQRRITEKDKKEAKTAAARTDQKGRKAVSGVGLKGGERIKVIGADDKPIEAPKPVENVEEEGTTTLHKPRIRSKKYKAAKSKIDKTKLYPIKEAIELVKETSYSTFDGTMELHLSVKKVGSTQNVELPHSFGKAKRIEIADEKTIEKLEKGKIDFDLLLATADMMPKLVPFAKLLGPKGMMPNPKIGTLIKDKKDAGKFSASTVTIKTEKKAPLIHTTVGKVSQKESELEENINAIIEALSTKQIEKAFLKATMSPSVKLEL